MYHYAMYRVVQLCIITLVWIGVGVLMSYSTYGYVSACVQTCFLLSISYVGHVLAHALETTFPFTHLNTHIWLHHNEKKHTYLSKPFELFVEILNNLFGFFIIYACQTLFHVPLFDPLLIAYAAFIYASIHLYYSIVSDTYHVEHHKNPYTNYSPELLDILGGTKNTSITYDPVRLEYEILPALLFYGVYLGLKSMENNTLS
jgi:hypothetical protein